MDKQDIESQIQVKIELHVEEIRNKGTSENNFQWILDDYEGDVYTQSYLMGSLSNDDYGSD